MAHVRRKFARVHKAQGSAIADEAIRQIAELYAVEKVARGLPPDKRAEIRQAEAKPVFDSLEAWLNTQLPNISGKSPLASAIRYALTGAFDAVISHNRYTLVDQSAEPLIQECFRRGIAFVNAAPYGGGILAKGPDKVAKYCYAPAEARVLDQVRRMDAVCAARGVPMAAAALQFSMRDPRVTSTIVGMSEPKRIAQTLALASHPIPDDVWQELGALIDERGRASA